MTIQSVIDIAKVGELQNLAAKNNNNTILTFINMGMIELYKRFPLKVEEHIIPLKTGQSIYTMPENYMWAIAAYDEVENFDYDDALAGIPINEEDNPASVNTISYNQIQVPVSFDGAYISIIYVAAPDYIYYTDTEVTLKDYDNATDIVIPANSFYIYTESKDEYGLPVKAADGQILRRTPIVAREIDLPPQMIEPLVKYIGYRASSALPNTGQAEEQANYQLFDAACMRIEQRGMFTSDDLDMLKNRRTDRLWA